MDDCIFCKIANHEISTQALYEDQQVIAFRDLHPQAPIHFLVIPKQHIASLNEITQETENLAGHILFVAAKVAKELGLKNGYRLVVNTGDDGGQTVEHLHFHVLGGRQMDWPPG